MKIYAFKNKETGDYLAFDTSSTDDEYSVSVEYSLSESGDNIYVHTSIDTMEKIFNSPNVSDWWNAGPDNPLVKIYGFPLGYEIVSLN